MNILQLITVLLFLQRQDSEKASRQINVAEAAFFPEINNPFTNNYRYVHYFSGQERNDRDFLPLSCCDCT